MRLTRTIAWLLLVGVGLWAVSGLPLLVGWRTTPPDQVYLARVPITASDTAAYYSQIEQARQGQLLFTNQFTSQAQRPTLFHPLWLVTGWLAASLQVDAAVAYQLARLLATLGFVWLAWAVLGRMFPSLRTRWVALIVLTTSSGLGWLTTQEFRQHIDLAATPVDLWVAESNTFLSISHSALFIGSQALILFILWQFWRWVEGERTRGQRWVGPALALLALIHPYDLITVAAVMLAWVGWQTLQGFLTKPRWRGLVMTAAGWALWVIPVVLYDALIVFREPAMLGWLQQNLDYTSAPFLVLLAYGLLVPLAAFGAYDRRSASRSLTAFLVVWVVVNMLLLYLPGLTVQRRLMNGLHIPFAILAAGGLFALTRELTRRWRRVVVGLVVTVMTFSNVRSLAVDTLATLPDQAVHYPPRIARTEAAAAAWLRAQTEFDDVIWSDVWLGNAIPGLAGRTVVMGHAHQTLNLQGRLRDWLAFREPWLTDGGRTNRLTRLRVRYLVWRDQDQLPGGYQPATDARWRLRFAAGGVRVFELRRPGP